MSSGGWGLREVTVRFGERTALDDVSFKVAPGQIVSLVGGDGAGKTTALRVLTGRVRPDTGRASRPDPSDIGFQPATSGTWAELSVDENLDLVAGAYRLDRRQEVPRRTELLDAAGLTRARSRLASQLSGGMRQKLGFCMAILHQPALLVLDEPSTGVDPVSRVELWGLIAAAAAQGAAVAMATTYLDEAERTHRVLVLDQGVALLSGTPAEVLGAAPGTVTEVPASTDPARAWRRGRATRQWHPGGPRPGETAAAADMEDAVVAAALQRHLDLGLPDPERPPPAPDPDRRSGATLSSAVGVSRLFGASVAVDDVTVRVGSGEIVGLIGANGAGKTTLIRMLLGVLTPSSGAVTFFGRAPSREGRRRLGYVPQGLGLYRDLTAAENLAFVDTVYRSHTTLAAALGGDRAELTGDIGLGRQRRLAFACALAHSPDLLVLDEPTSGVDPLSRARLWDTIHEQAESGVGVLVSTHYMQEAEQCDRLVLMDLGRVVAEGTLGAIMGTATAVEVATDDWQGAFGALRSHDLAVSLSGTNVRVADLDPAAVQSVLSAALVAAVVREVPATLEEILTVISRRTPTLAAS